MNLTWTLIGSGPSGCQMEDPAPNVIAINTAIDRVDLDIVTHYLFRQNMNPANFPKLVEHGIELICFHATPGANQTKDARRCDPTG